MVGALHVVRSLRPEECQGSVWASGPFCNVVGASCTLATPVAAQGSLGLWKPEPAVLEHVRYHRFNRGDNLMRRGEEADSVAVLLQGKLDAHVAPGQVLHVKPGELVGEVGFFKRQVRTVDVIGASDGGVLSSTMGVVAMVVDRPTRLAAVTKSCTASPGSRPEPRLPPLLSIGVWRSRVALASEGGSDFAARSST